MNTDRYYSSTETDYVSNWFDTSNYVEIRKRLLHAAKKQKKKIMKDEKGAKIITKFAAVLKSYSYAVQKDSNEIEDLEFVKEKGVK